ncbi:MAG: hypothetical protein LBV46_00415 [Bacteroidales bacterium]|jgi:hypothetical protein|nr:hypothetical protein [Bacteroidales bacterium]
MMMKNLKLLFFQIMLIIGLIIGMNYLYQFVFLEKDLQKHSPIINLTRAVVKDSCEIVYIDASSNITMRWDDCDKRSISSFIADYFPDKKVGDITKPATHSGIYYELLRNIPQKSTVKTVIVAFNLRSFDAAWIYSSLETALQKELVLLKDNPPLYNRFLLSFKGYDIKTEQERAMQLRERFKLDILKFPYPFPYKTVAEWDRMMASQIIPNPDSSSTINLTRLACDYIKTYAFQIDTLTNPRIKDYDNIVKLAKKRGWNLIFCFMAENVEKAQELVGKDLLFLMKQNRDLLVERYRRLGVTVVDNLSSLPNEEYIEQDWTTEHYAEKGRKIIARHVADSLKKFYPDSYKEVVYENKPMHEFFNDCEEDVLWGQQQTLTKEKFHSPKKSSKTGGIDPFGLTFEYAIAHLPDSIRQVTVEMYVYQNDTEHDALFMLEIKGKENNNLSHPLKTMSQTVKKWVKVQHTFVFDENFYKNELIKIYLYNPSMTSIYVDDIHIRFEK